MLPEQLAQPATFDGNGLAELRLCAALLPAGLAVSATPLPPAPSLRVMELSAAMVDSTSSARGDVLEPCHDWSLTPRQAEESFRQSEPDGFAEYIHRFDTAACKITGRLRREDGTWQFTINAAGNSMWRQGTEVRYFGCWTTQCARVLSSRDFIAPDSI
ncbi:hypothetical protein [Luteimonas terrae]|uniref:Uncharacterized protein n=1 Tax=Luteimonas terrae TaxID=1530191 RepID=A0ABU1Y0H5_9GAMM|nr:hypothetical protein [Luteimonas terrae]MDR7194523.1 hypothetical protein [Luteimonas terrae]